jgi:hypothetical protein
MMRREEEARRKIKEGGYRKRYRDRMRLLSKL